MIRSFKYLISIFATLLIYDFGIKTTINSIVTLFTIYICINNIVNIVYAKITCKETQMLLPDFCKNSTLINDTICEGDLCTKSECCN